MPAVQIALPGDTGCIALELGRRVAVSIESPVLVPDVDARVVEVDAVRPLVLVLHAVQVEEVGDEPLTVALDHLAPEGPVAAPARGVVVAVGLVRLELRRCVGEQQPVEVPAVPEVRRGVTQLADDAQDHPHALVLLDPLREAWLLPVARPMTSRPNEWNVEARMPSDLIPAAANRAPIRSCNSAATFRLKASRRI